MDDEKGRMIGYVIEKNVPRPNSRRNGRAIGIYPFHAMVPGDSVYVAGKSRDTINAALHRERKLRPGRTFAVEIQDGGVRVWRLT